MNRDVFLAILAMDSYNRGYNQGVAGLSNLGQIGDATIIDIPLPAGSITAGFYALSYTVTEITVTLAITPKLRRTSPPCRQTKAMN